MKQFVNLTIALMLTLTVAAQATVTVVGTDGTESQYLVDATGEIYFGTDYMAILTSGTASDMPTYLLDNVQKVLFSESVNRVDVSGAATLGLVPNPAAESFSLHGLGDSPRQVTVYGMSGAMVLQGRYADGERIDISALPKGIYMVRACTSVVKLVKR